MRNQLLRRRPRPTVLSACVRFSRGSTRLETTGTVQLAEIAQTVPLGVDPLTTVTAIIRPGALNPQPRLTAMLRAWKVSAYLRDAGLGGSVITQTSSALDEATASLGSVLVTVEYLE